jgi:hypothetical protein
VWDIQGYKIEKLQCPDLVSAYYTVYSVSINGKITGNSASQVDSCRINWLASNDQYFKFDVCSQSVQVDKPVKQQLNFSNVDSVALFSNEYHEQKLFTKSQVKEFILDWNQSSPSGFDEHQFDSSFSATIPYQYRITVYSGKHQVTFFGYNYIILDRSGWTYKMTDPKNLNYFHRYWGK